MRINHVKRALKEGKTAVGTFVKLTDPSSVEIMGMAGFDFFVLDNEHVAMDKSTVTNMLRASDITGIVPLIRVRENTAAEILQALDAGALGVQVPNVDTYGEAKLAVESTRYAPKGNRGFAPTQRSAGFGFMNKFEYVKMANEEVLTVIHCETLTSLENLDKILTLEELDVVFIGPMDLSQSMGEDVMGKDDHPRLQEAIDQIIEKVIKAGKIAGTVAGNADAAKKLMEKGVRYVVISADMGMIMQSAKKIVSDMKK